MNYKYILSFILGGLIVTGISYAQVIKPSLNSYSYKLDMIMASSSNLTPELADKAVLDRDNTHEITERLDRIIYILSNK